MAIRVSPTEDSPSHHISLTDSSSTELGLICADAQGNRVSRVGINPYPAMASQLRQGRGKHADRVPPFEDIALSDFSGGMAMLHHDEDASKYLEGYRMDTSQAGRMMLGGRERYTTGIRDFNELRPSGTTRSAWVALYSGGTTSVVDSFVVDCDTSYEADKAVVWLKKTGSPTGNVTVSLLSSADAVLKSKTYAAASAAVAAPFEVEFDWTTTETLADTTTYKLQVAYSGGDSDNCVSVFCVQSSSEPYYRVLDNTGAYNMLFFEYRGSFYGITQPEDRSNSKLYILGYHGLADANTGALTTLIDATQAWTVDALIGREVKIIAGDGSWEEQPNRTITDNDATTVTVDPTWRVEHTVNTEYAIQTDEWFELEAFDYYVTTVEVTDRIIHIGGGAEDYHHRIRFGNNDGTWTFQGNIGVDETEEIWRSNRLLAIRDDHYKHVTPVYDLWVARTHRNTADRNTLNSVMKTTTPPYWGSPYFPIGQLTDGQAWMASEYANVDNYSDRGRAAIEWNATFTTGHVAGKTLDPPVDVTGAETIFLSLYSDTALAAGDLQLKLLDGKDTLALDFPAIVAEDDMDTTRKWYEIPIHALNTPIAGSDYPDFTAISYLNINVVNDKNAIIKLKIGDEGLILATRNPNNERYELGLTEYVTNMIEYGGGAGQVARKPWIGTNKNLYYIESGQLKPIYLREIEELEHYRNCEGMCVNDVYLYFNQGEKIQRYYSGKLDNIGPDAEYGLPEARRGVPCSMASYPGKVLACVDAGDSGTSTVMYRKNHGWHEFYRAPLAGERIRRIHVLGRNDITDQVFISEGSDVLWVPISVNPEYDSDYEHTNFGEIITSRIYGGLRETEKYYHALTTVQEEHIQGGQYAEIYIDYRTSESPTTWVAIADDFSDIPRERNTLVSTNDVKGRWIQFRIRFETQINAYSPILVSMILDSVERLDVNNTYSYTVELKEGTTLDLAGYQETQTGVQKLTQLETWVDSPLPLTLNTCSAFEDDKLVFLEGVRKRVLYHTVDDIEQEVRLADLTLIEVE